MKDGPLQHFDAARDARGLSWAAKFVLFVLIAFMGPRGIFPSQETIAAVAGLSKRKVISSLGELRARNVIKVARAGRTATNEYEIDFVALRSLVPPRDARDVNDVHLATCTPCTSEVNDVHLARCTPCTQKDPSKKEPREGADPEPLQLVPTPATAASKAGPEVEVWDHYQTVRKRWRSRSRLTALGDKDRREIRARLKAGYTIDDLKLAIDGLFASAFHRDGNYLAIEYALRGKSIDGFIDDAERERRQHTAPRPSPANASPSHEVDPSRVPSGGPVPRSIDEPNAPLADPREEPRPYTFDLGALAEELTA